MSERDPRLGRRVGVAIMAGCLAVALGGCSFADRLVEDEVEAPSIEAFYELPDDVASGDPGSLVRSQEIAGAPDGASAWRVIYRTTDQAGAPVVASGLVVAPSGTAPDGGRPVVAWGHPTTGTAPECAPSRWDDPFLLMEGLSELLDRGFVVAATDYVGSGVDGPNSYLVGATAATAVLDAVRAAQALPDTAASDDLLTWGHSQGGQAALFAASDAASYAPELTVRGVAVAAPAADLPKLLDAHLDDISGVTIGAYAFAAYAEVYGPSTPDATLESILTPAGVAAVPAMNELCLATQASEIHDLARPLIGQFMTSDPRTTEPWATLLAENVPDAVPADLPVFIAQGLADELIAPAETKAYADGLAANGNAVEYVEYPDIDHGTVGYRAVPRLVEWIDALALPGATIPG
ncbi:lipase family protein [Agromyces aerolatus]|uniref:lipase family protein n=1 Tax=Agromyces sp. LY-1074 TaxID=3074080 RepID=UPI00285727E4|nr:MULTISPECIES: lipase family protein [unclassified Agromyces]MDR5700278.1 lipase family protein [Agromyces sp. LY-1074]MDR5706744.1 lipase family protein [Agromyces sp. LY-1358]